MTDVDDEEKFRLEKTIKIFDMEGLMKMSNANNQEKNTDSSYEDPDTRTVVNNQFEIHNQIANNLSNDEYKVENDISDDGLIDLDSSKIIDRTKTLDEIYAIHFFRKDPNKKTGPNESKNTKFFEKLLNPMEYGTIRGSVFGLSSICLESGAMLLAIRCEQFGLVNYLILIILGGLLAYWCLVMMVKASKNINEKNYSTVTKIILGRKVGIILDIIIALSLLGDLISFQVIIYQMIGAIVYDIKKITGNIDEKVYSDFIEYKDKYWAKTLYLKFPVMLGIAVLSFPLCIIEDISKMRIPSLIGVLAIIYSILVVIVESFFYLINENYDKHFNWIDIRPSFSYKDGIPFFGGIATVFYLYSCHAGAYPVYNSLENNTMKRIKKVFWRSILLDICVYFLIAAASFITVPNASEEEVDLILFRNNLSGFDPDYFIIIAKFGMIFNLFFDTPANYAAFRLSFFALVWGNTNLTKKKNMIVTAGVLLLCTIIGALYDQILEYFELIGGFCAAAYCILIPGLIYVKNRDLKTKKIIKNIILFVVIFLFIFGYVSGFLTILFNMAHLNS